MDNPVDHVQYYDVQLNIGNKKSGQSNGNGNYNHNFSTAGETIAQNNPYAHYFSKRKEKQNNERNAGNHVKADKFINKKSANSMVRIQHTNKSAAIQGSRLMQKNLADRNLSLKSLGSHKLSDVSLKVSMGHKLNGIGGPSGQAPANQHKVGSGLGNTNNQQNHQNGASITAGSGNNNFKQSQSQFQKMSQIYGSAEAILTGNQLEILSNENNHQALGSAIALRSIDTEQNNNKNGGNQSIIISQRNDNQNAIAGVYQYNLSNQNQQQFLKKNQKPAGKKLNDLQAIQSKKSSSSVQKSPMNQRSIEGNLNDVINSQTLSKKLKRDSSFQDSKLQLQQAGSSKGLYLNMSLDKQQTIQSQPDQNQILQQVIQSSNNKWSPSKQGQNAQKNHHNFQAGAPSRNLKMNINSTASTNPSTSQVQLRNQKSSNQQKVGQILIHPSSLTKMQQIKNIYSMQSTQNQNNKYAAGNANAVGGASVEHGSAGTNTGVNNSMLEIANYNGLDVSQQSSIQFNPGASGTPKLNESQTSNYQNIQNTSLSLVSKTISIQGQNINKKNNQQFIPNEYGVASSPKDVGEIFTNQRKSQQSQKTVNHVDKDSISMLITKNSRNGVNTQSNTIAASKSGGLHHTGSSNLANNQVHKVGINKQLQKGSRNYTNDQTLRQTQKSQWNTGSQNSKKNSYYNTKSSFGIRNSNKNIAKQSIDYSKMEVRGKGGQIAQTSVKQPNKNANSNILPKPMKLSSQFTKEQQQAAQNPSSASQSVLDMSKIPGSHRHHSRNLAAKLGQKTESIAQNSATNQEKQRKLAAYHEGPTSRSLEPVETLDIEGESATKITNLHQYFKHQNIKNQRAKAESNFLQDLEHSKQYLRNSNNQIPLIKNYNANLKKNNQLANISQKHLDQNFVGTNSRSQKGLADNGGQSLLSGQEAEKQKISKTEAQNTSIISKKQLHSFVDNPIESSNVKEGDSSRKADSKSLEAVDYFHQQGKAFKQHMKSQQLKSRLKNLQYSQAATESQHSMVDQKSQAIKMRGPKPNLEHHSSNPSNIQSTNHSVKHQLPQINGNTQAQSKSETKVTNKFETQIKTANKGKHDSALSMQKNRHHIQMTEERANKVQSKIGSPDQLSEQQTALKTPQNNNKLFKKNFQYSQNVSKNLINIENVNKKTPNVEEQSSQLLVQDSDIDVGRQSTSNHNTKIDAQSQERASAMNESYENINVPNLINQFSKRKASNVNNSRLDDKYSPQVKDTASYSSMERPTGKQASHPQTVNKDAGKYKIYRKNQKLEALNNQSDGSFPNVNNNQLTDELRFAPMNGVRDGFGVGPGTANTHGGYTRQKYKRNQDQSNNVNYKLPSQQCYSEIVNFDNQGNGHGQHTSQNGPTQFDNNQQDFNIISTFEQSFEYAFDPVNFQNLDALDPKDEFDLQRKFEGDAHGHGFGDNGQFMDGQSSIPSIHSVPVVRNQKSQATQRHNHQKISVSHKYHYYNNNGPTHQPSLHDGNTGLGAQSITQQQFDNMTNLNVSQLSGPHDMVPSGYQVHRHPQSIKDGHRINNNKAEFSSFINNDTKINASQISQLSNDSDIGGLTTDMIIHNGGTRTTQNQHQMYLSKRDGSAPHKDKSGLANGNGGALSTGEEGNPFSGPKLHLFRKGQSKSSQSKQRKIKTSQYHQRLHEINSNYSNLQNYNNSIIQNYGQGAHNGGPISAPSAQSVVGPNGFSATQSQQAGSQVYQRQLSEGGPVNSMKKKSHSNTRKPKEGHINISEILNGNFKLQPANSKYINADQLYTDTRSQNSQGLISQNSNEFGNGPPKGINIGENSRNFNDVELQSQTYQKNKDILKKERENSNEMIPTSAIIDPQFDSRIQNTPSQFSTIQQNVSANMFDDGESQDEQRPGRNTQDHSDTEGKVGGNGSNFHFPMLAGVQSSKSNIENLNQFNQMSPYLGGSNNNSTQRLGLVRKLQNESLQLPPQATNSVGHPIDQNDTYLQRLYEQQKQGMRPNTTNPTEMILTNNELHQASPDTILQKPKIPVQKLLKPIKAPSHSNASFKHPKVGNNSKHPQVFKNLQSLPGKNGQMQTKSQQQLRGVAPSLQANTNSNQGPTKQQQLSGNNGYQLGLIYSHSIQEISHSQEQLNNKYGGLLLKEEGASAPNMPMTDVKKLENNDPLNDTQLTDTELNTRSRVEEKSSNRSRHHKELDEDSQQNLERRHHTADHSDEQQNRNQHFETTFEGFNKNNSKKKVRGSGDQNQTVNESSNDVEFKLDKSKEQQILKAHRMNKESTLSAESKEALNEVAKNSKKSSEHNNSRNSRNNAMSQQNVHQPPSQSQKQPQKAIMDQANLMQLNQLMEQEIDKNELSNNSARKGKGGENPLQRSIDAKKIQLLREKNYQEERNKFDSENKNNNGDFSQANTADGKGAKRVEEQNNIKSTGGKSLVSINTEQEIQDKRTMNQVNGLNSINSAVPSSVTQIQAELSLQEGQDIQQPSPSQPPAASKKLVSNQDSKIVAMKPINQDLTAEKSAAGEDETHQAMRSSVGVEDMSPMNGGAQGGHLNSPQADLLIGSDQQNNGQLENGQLEVSANAGGLNMNQTQTSHSIAQTPCFAETPNTTDQFKGYKIDPNDRINMSGIMLNTQQLNLPSHQLMASSNGMIGVSVSGSNRGLEQRDGSGNMVMTPQMGQGSLVNSRGMSAKIQNKNAIPLINGPFQHEIVESESLLESEADDVHHKKETEKKS